MLRLWRSRTSNGTNESPVRAAQPAPSHKLTIMATRLTRMPAKSRTVPAMPRPNKPTDCTRRQLP